MDYRIVNFRNAWKQMYKEEPPEEKIKEAFPDYILPVVTEEPQVKTQYQETPPPSSISKVWLYFIKTIFALLSLGCSIASIYFSFILFARTFHPAIALIVAVCVVGFLVFAFAGSRIISLWYMRWLIKTVAIVIMLYSMYSTIAGQYNNQTETLVTNSDTTKNTVLEIIQTELDQINNDLAIVDKELEETARELQLSAIKDMNDPTYNALFWKNYRAGERKKELLPAREVKNNELKKYLTDNPSIEEKTERKDFYFFLSVLFKWPVKLIEFLSYIFPAIFIDIMAPLGLYIASYKTKT